MHNISLWRQEAQDILRGISFKKVVVCGPCSIHDPDSAIAYGKELKKLSRQYHDHLFIVMRVFLEKPRTHNKWRGFINDPDLDGSLNLDKGIKDSILLLQDLNALDLPLATEFIDPILSSLTQEFMTWGFIGARTVRSATHRQLASFLTIPVGFKNPLDGDLDAVYAAIDVASSPHKALWPDKTKKELCIQSTPGNYLCHGVLRGHHQGPNYQQAVQFSHPCLIDCAHGNAHKSLKGMITCFYEAIDLSVKHPHIKGVMLESFLNSGCQKPSQNLNYGVSITDPCLSLEQTALMLDDYYKLLSQSQGSSSSFIESCLMSGSSSEM